MLVRAQGFLIEMKELRQDVQFANVDLELVSVEDLQVLIDNLVENVDVQHHGRLENKNDFASLSLRNVETGVDGKPDTPIRAFCSLIEKLPLEPRQIWNNCMERRFDIGFESGNSKKGLNTNLGPETIKRIAGIHGSIAITIYPIPNSGGSWTVKTRRT